MEGLSDKKMPSVIYRAPNGDAQYTPNITFGELYDGDYGFGGSITIDIWDLTSAVEMGPQALQNYYDETLKGKNSIFGFKYGRNEAMDMIKPEDFNRLMDECIKRHSDKKAGEK